MVYAIIGLLAIILLLAWVSYEMSGALLKMGVKLSLSDFYNPHKVSAYLEKKITFKEVRAEVRVMAVTIERGKLPVGYVERNLARQMVTEMDLTDLQRLFKFDVITPHFDGQTPRLGDGSLDEFKMMLARKNEYEYRARVLIPQE
jgi:hypothetical protein